MLVNKAIFPVAGLGTRFLPATKAQPKEMLPVVDKPLIQYAVEEAYAAGVREMIFVTGRHKRADRGPLRHDLRARGSPREAGKQELLDVVRAVKPDDMECIYVRQPQALGLGHAVLCGRSAGRQQPVRRAAGRRPDGRRRRRCWRRWSTQFDEWRASIIAVQEVPAEHTRRYGIVAGTPVSERLVDIEPHRREAGARGRAVAPRRGRPLHPDAAACSTRSPTSRAASAARSSSPTASPGCCAARRCSPTATRASATTAAARKASCRPTSSWRSTHPRARRRTSATT